MFIRLAIFVCVILASVQHGNSSPDDDKFGSFWGPCPAAPIKTTSALYLTDILGKWYTHRVLGQYSPWKNFECQSHTISTNRKQNPVNVTSRFLVPGIDWFEWNGIVQAVNTRNGIFEFYYYIEPWYYLQSTTFMETYYRQGATLTWTCLDFFIFHIESIALMTKYQDPNDTRIDPYVFKNMEETLKRAGISPDWFQSIDQNDCENYSSSSASFLSSSLKAIKSWKSTVLEVILQGLYKIFMNFI